MMALCEEMDSCVSNPTSSTKMVSSEEGIVSGVASEKSLKGKSHDIKLEALESSREVNTICIIPHKTPQGYARPISSVKPEKVSETSYSNVLALVPSQEGRTPPMTPENAPQKPDSSVHTLQSGQEGSNSSAVREKTLDDGYNWRKYGQKNVKGNEYIRSYYRCTHRNCQVKRQVERSHDGQITDTIYFGEHDHPKSQGNLPLAVGIVVSIVEDRSADPSATIVNDKYSIHRKTPNQVAHPTVAGSDDVKTELSNGRRDKTDNNDVPDTKRQKKDYFYASPLGKSMGKQSHVVKTMSEVDAVSDGYRWRKYGQKLVKGNPNPRSYYRCSSSGCPVKKHVERASHDPKMVVATYEGQHDHDMPPCRTVTYTMVGQNDQMSPQDGEPDTKLRDYEAVCLDMVVHSSSDHHGTVEENSQMTVNAGESGTKTREHNAVCLDMVVHRSSDSHDSLPRKNQTHSTAGENTKATSQDGESNSKRKESDTIAPDVAIHASSVVANKSDERPNGDSETKSEVYDSITIHSSPDGGSRQSNKLKTNKSGDNSEENNSVGLNTAGPENGSTGPVIERATNIKSRSCP